MRSYLACVATLVASSALAAGPADRPDVKLGLWEMTTTTAQSGKPQIDTTGMTPAQVAQLQAMLQQNAAAGQHTVTKTCVTAEDLDKDDFLGGQADEGCTRTVITRTRTVREMKEVCTSGQPRTIHSRIEVLTP